MGDTDEFSQLINTTAHYATYHNPLRNLTPPHPATQQHHSGNNSQGVDLPTPWLGGGAPQESLWRRVTNLNSPQTASTGISIPAALRGNTTETDTTEAAAASNATFFEDQVLGLPPLHFDCRQNKEEGEEFEEEEEEEEEDVEEEEEVEEEDAPSPRSHLVQQLSSGERLLSAIYRLMTSMQSVELPELPLEPPRWPKVGRLKMTPPPRRKIDKDGYLLDERDFGRDGESSSESEADEEDALDGLGSKGLGDQGLAVESLRDAHFDNRGFYHNDVLGHLNDKSPWGGDGNRQRQHKELANGRALRVGVQERAARGFEPVVPHGQEKGLGQQFASPSSTTMPWPGYARPLNCVFILARLSM